MNGEEIQKRYRPSVAGIVRRGDGRVLVCERLAPVDAWQFPQGGVNRGETHVSALHRELWEEVSLRPHYYRVVEERGPYRYDFLSQKLRRGWHGQEQRYFLCEIDPAAVDRASVHTRKPEFRQLQWIYPEQFHVEWLPVAKREVYARVFADFFGIEMRKGPDLSLTSPRP